MKTKIFLPMLAMIFAIGMSFGSVKSDDMSATGFIQKDGGWEQVDVNCNDGPYTCRMYYSSNPNEEYVVHDAPGGNPLLSTSPNAIRVVD